MNPRPEDFDIFLRSRRSVRKFSDQPVADETVREILATATYAPSAHGLQPWRFALVEGLGSRSALATALTVQMRADVQAENTSETEIRQREERSRQRIAAAPRIILLCRDSKAVRIPHPAEDWMGMQSVAMAGLQLMLAAHARGLGSVWVCWPLYAQEATQRALKLPASWQPEGMVLLGYGAGMPKDKSLHTVEAVTLSLRD